MQCFYKHEGVAQRQHAGLQKRRQWVRTLLPTVHFLTEMRSTSFVARRPTSTGGWGWPDDAALQPRGPTRQDDASRRLSSLLPKNNVFWAQLGVSRRLPAELHLDEALEAQMPSKELGMGDAKGRPRWMLRFLRRGAA